MGMLKPTFGLIVLFASVIFAEPPIYTSSMENFKMVSAAAKSGLERFSQLIDDQNFKRFGFDTPDQIKQAILGIPIRRFIVRMKDLQNYKSSTPGQKLLRETGEVSFPILVHQKFRSSLTIVRNGTKWEPSVFGAANYMRLISEARTKSATKESQRPEAYIEVVIPPLNVTFLGRESEGKLLLIPVITSPRYGLEPGRSVNAEVAFTKLSPFARKHKDLPS